MDKPCQEPTCTAAGGRLAIAAPPEYVFCTWHRSMRPGLDVKRHANWMVNWATEGRIFTSPRSSPLWPTDEERKAQDAAVRAGYAKVGWTTPAVERSSVQPGAEQRR